VLNEHAPFTLSAQAPRTMDCPQSQIYIFTSPPNPICYTKCCIVQQNVKAMFVSHVSDVRHPKCKRVCLSVCRYAVGQYVQLQNRTTATTKRINKIMSVYVWRFMHVTDKFVKSAEPQ